MNIYNQKSNLNDNQQIYEIYNSFISSSERKVFFKMLWRIKFWEMTKDIHGDIIECGVFKGIGLILWLKLLEMEHPHSIKKVIGFDFFNPDFVNNLSNHDKNAMSQVFKRDKKLKKSDTSIENVKEKIIQAGIKNNKFDLVKGDISITSLDYIKDKPGLRISLLYLDLDLEKPTYDALNTFWERVVPNGIIVFDEYAYHIWSESNAVDRFIKEKNLKLFNTNIETPTAYIIKK